MKYIHIIFRIIDMIAVVVIGSLLLFGCKAKQIDWQTECSQRFPIQKEYVQGQTVVVSDTIQLPGIITNADPILIRTKCPGNKLITITKTRIDTIKAENTAKISALENENKETKELVHESQQQTLKALKIVDEERANRKRASTQRNFIALGLLISIGIHLHKPIIKIISLIM